MTFKTLLKKNILIITLVRLRNLLPPSFKKRAVIVFVLLLTNSLLELAGLGALLPLFIGILQPDAFESGWLASLYTFSGLPSTNAFILTLSGLVLTFIIFKNLLSLWIVNYQAKFSFGLYQYFATRLQLFFYQKGFLYFKSRNHNLIKRDINAVPMFFAQNMLLSILSLLTEIVILVLIVISIMIYDYKIMLMLAVIVVPVFLIFYGAVKNKVASLAEGAYELQAEIGKVLYQSIFGYVDIMINNNKEWFFRAYKKDVDRFSVIKRHQYIYNLMPAKVIETTMIFGILIIIAYGILLLPTRGDLLVLLGVFALAAYRILPSINRMLQFLMQIKSYQFTLDVIEPCKNLVVEEKLINQIDFKSEIKISDLFYHYPNHPEWVLKGINLSIKKGERIGFIGRSGSGKTTLINLLLGFIQPTKGLIQIDKQELTENSVNSWRKWIGYVQQEVFLVDGTLAENIALGYGEIDRDQVLKVAERASLNPLINELSQGIDTKVGERGANISGGQRQRVGIARALYSGAKILFLDEATSSLDSETEKEITDAIHHLSDDDLTMVIIAHRLSTLKYCDRIIELKNGLMSEKDVDNLVN